MSAPGPGGVVVAASTTPADASAAATNLRSAAARGDVAACRRLLSFVTATSPRCVRFSRDQRGRSALHLAAAAGHAPVVRLLLDVAAPKEIDAPDGEGRTALQLAAAGGHEEVVRVAVARGTDVDRQDTVHANTALHECSWKGYSRCVRLLISAGANLSKSNVGGFTALHLCCQNGHNQSCRELLLAGCDPDVQNNYGDTALHTAARYGHAGVTRILISAQCRVSEQNKNGDTALHIAAAMGRRKLTRILLEAGCEREIRNKQGETARDIALRKDLGEIVEILEECRAAKDKKNKEKSKKRSKSRVRFERGNVPDASSHNLERPKHWSPYGCHYYPDPEAFPSPRLDSLPREPLKRGEQYYLDLAGNIRKGPVSIGYTCYCAPLFRHLEARLERDKRELQRAQFRLGQRVAGLEQKLSREQRGRHSERIFSNKPKECTLSRSKSLEMLDEVNKPPLQITRSMDELEGPDETEIPRPSVKELVARIQNRDVQNNNSESSDEELPPQTSKNIPANFVVATSSNAPRSRSAVYSPNVVLIDSNTTYIEPNLTAMQYEQYHHPGNSSSKEEVKFVQHSSCPTYYDHHLNSKLNQLEVFDAGERYENKDCPSRILMVQNQDQIDKDTNNDSGYSTKMYGSSKGNSPSLSGQIDGDCVGASSLV